MKKKIGALLEGRNTGATEEEEGIDKGIREYVRLKKTLMVKKERRSVVQGWWGLSKVAGAALMYLSSLSLPPLHPSISF